MTASDDMNNKNENGGLQLVPEAVLKKKHDMDEMKAKRAAQAVTNPRGNRKIFSTRGKRSKVNKAETFISNARARRNHEIRYKRVLKKGMQKRASNKKVVQKKTIEEDDPSKDNDNDDDGKEATTAVTTVSYQSNSVDAPMVFVVRVRDEVGCSISVKRALSQLRLRNIYEGVFCRYNESARKMLHLVEPWVVYGVPSRGMVEDLIKRRGHGKVEGKRVPLSDNTIIEEALGADTGMICVEDMVHELYEVGASFAKANAFLWPFRLAAPKSKFQKQKLNEKDKREDYGDKGQEMDEYIKQMS